MIMLFPTQDSRIESAVRGLPGAVIGTEDCLHLAVHTPELPSGDHNPKLPVMVTTKTILTTMMMISMMTMMAMMMMMGLRIVCTQQSFKTVHLPFQLLSSNLVVFLRTYSTI